MPIFLASVSLYLRFLSVMEFMIEAFLCWIAAPRVSGVLNK